jgi:hypothetical protein
MTQTTNATQKLRNFWYWFTDTIKNNPTDILLAIVSLLLMDANSALDNIQDLNEIQAAADLDLL